MRVLRRDNITVSRFEQQAQARLLAVKELISDSRYPPADQTSLDSQTRPEKRRWVFPRCAIGGASLRMVIEPIFEKEFAPQSYGFRPGEQKTR